MENLKVKDIMIKKLVTAGPEDSVVYAAKLLSEHRYNGLPIISQENVLIGILTEYDLVSQANAMRLPTLINILGNISYYKNNKRMITDDLRNLMTLKVKDVMNNDPLFVEENAWIQEVADLFAHHHRVNPIPVVDKNRKLVGIVSRYDLVKLFADKGAEREIDAGDETKINEKIDSFIENFEQKFLAENKVGSDSEFILLIFLSLASLILAGFLIWRYFVR